MSTDFNELNEQMRREIRERADIFMYDAREIAKKYGDRSVEPSGESVAVIASMLANQYAAEIVSMSMRSVAEEAADMTRNFKLYQSHLRKAG